MRTSPFSAATIEEAYDRYCAEILPMHRDRGKTKPRKATWIKQNQAKFDAFHEQKAKPSANSLEAQIEHLRSLLEANGVQVEAASGTREMTEVEAIQAFDPPVATNGQLWRLNGEGLLGEAIEESTEDGYITKEAANAVLERTFGPRKARA